MSQSPEELPPNATLDDLDEGYVESASRLNQLIDRGASWSGHEKNCCFLNTGQLQFANVSSVTGLDFADDGRAVGLVDWDFDGDLDFWTVNRTAPRLRLVRNDWDNNDAHFVMLRLRGTSSNRDAIGARVEVVPANPDGTKFIRTLRAGEAFLSQSSKWLHFGLGGVEQIEKVIVRWPGGDHETFTEVEVDKHYELIQDSAIATPFSPPGNGSELTPLAVELPTQSSGSRALLTSPIPIPSLDYVDQQQANRSLAELEGRPLFLNLWATWCRPCLLELKEFAEAKSKLQGAGVEVLALSVDPLNAASENSDDGEERIDPQATLRNLGFDLPSGSATESLVGQLEIILNYVYGPDRPMPLPVSILLDESGRLAAIYKGPTTPDQLLADVASLQANKADRLKSVVAHPGRWIAQPASLRPLTLAAQLANAGYDESVANYVSKHRFLLERDPLWDGFFEHLSNKLTTTGSQEQAKSFLENALAEDPENPDLLFRLGDVNYEAEEFALAEAYFRRALRGDPNHVSANFQLGNVLNRQGKFAESATCYLKAIEGDSQLADAHYQLATVLFRLGKPAAGMSSMKRYLSLKPDDANAHLNLGVMLAMQRNLDAAVSHLEKAAALDPQNGLIHNNLGRVRQDQGNDAAALRHYRLAKVDAKTRFAAQRNLSWLFATSSDDQIFDPAEAARLAQACVRESGGRDANSLGKLAAALAAGGKFPQAIQAAQKGLQVAKAEKNGALLAELQSQLQRYQAGKSLRRAKSK